MSDHGQPDPQQWGPPPQQQAPGQRDGGQPQQAYAPPPATAQVAVPSWLTNDWALAAQVAFIGQLLLLLGAALLTVVGVLRQIADIGLDRIDWAATAVRPLVELLGLNGAGAGEPLLLTGLLYLYLAYRAVAAKHPRTLRVIAADRSRMIAAGVKVALVSAAFLLVIAILLNSFADSLVLRAPSIAMTTSIDFTTLVFFTVFVGAVPAFLALLRGADLTLTRFLGTKPASSAMLRGGVAGARRTLLIGGASLLVLSTLGNLLDGFGGSRGFGDVLGQLVVTIERLVVQWLDQAILLMLGAAKFLHDGGYLWYFGPEAQAWMWVALPVLAAAFIVGGIAAAKLAGPRTQAEAMKSAVLVGPFVALVSLLVAIGWAGQPYIDDIVPIAILLPSLWGLLGVGGAWLWASQLGLPSGFVIGDATPAAPAQGASSGPGTSGPQAAGPASWDPPASSPPPAPEQAAPASWDPPASSPPPAPEQAGPASWDPPASSPPPAPEQAGPASWGPPAGTPQEASPGVGESTGDDEEIDLDALPPPGAARHDD